MRRVCKPYSAQAHLQQHRAKAVQADKHCHVGLVNEELQGYSLGRFTGPGSKADLRV